MQVIYERCAAVDVGKDVIAVAVRKPGDGPGGRVTVKRQYKTFYGQARWLIPGARVTIRQPACTMSSMPVLVTAGLPEFTVTSSASPDRFTLSAEPATT